VRTLRGVYVQTSNESLKIVYANAWKGNVCLEYMTYDARELGEIRYAVFEEGSNFVNYDLTEEDIVGRCSLTGADLTTVAEKELKDKAESGSPRYPLRKQ
jgi:hypothetical protein